jgi:hypothetical protein
LSDINTFLAEQGEASIRKPTAGGIFLSELSFQDLGRLRAAVKRVYMKHYPAEFFTDREADRMIEALAPDVVERLIRAKVDNTLLRRDGRVDRPRLRLDE